jgi:transcriptional regulator with XRE-family HTH domain
LITADLILSDERDRAYTQFMLEQSIGKRIAYLRRRAGHTQQELAEATGVSVETVSRMERGATFPSVSRLCQVAEALGVAVQDFFMFEEPATETDALVDEVVELLRGREPEDVRTIRDVTARILAGHKMRGKKS